MDEFFGGYVKYFERFEFMEEDIVFIFERNFVRDDKIIMLNGVEGRYFFFVFFVVSFVFKLLFEVKIVDGIRKVIFRKFVLCFGIFEWIVEREKRVV